MKKPSHTIRLQLWLVVVCAALGCSAVVEQDLFESQSRSLLTASGRVAYWEAPSLSATTTGEGPGKRLLLFLHDVGSDKRVWRGLVDRLNWSGRVVLMDLRGHGGSEAPGDGDYRVASAALDVVGLCQRLEAEQVVLVGHGWGGQVALRAAAMFGKSVRGVFLVDAMPEISQMDVMDQRAYLEVLMSPPDGADAVKFLVAPLLDGLSPEQAAEVMAKGQRLGRGVWTAVYQGLFQHRAADDFKLYRGPLLAVVSDANTGPLSLQNISEDVPCQVISGKGHYLMLTAPDVLSEMLQQFLELVKAK